MSYERDYTNDWDDPSNPNGPNYNPQPTPDPIHPGANTGSGPWAPGYDPGSNWNGGQAPSSGDPYENYNGGSPVDAPLQSGYGWEWSGPETPTWNMSSNNWDRGRWNQVEGRGLGFAAPTTTTATTNTGPNTTGGVPPIRPSFGGGGGGGYQTPSSTLPADILALFNKVPEKTPVQSAYQDALLKYMAKAQETPSLSDSTLAPQVEVFRAAQQRNTERQRLSAAERAAANGQSESGYLDNLINQGVQQQGFNTATYNANLLGGEMTKRREELQAALQLARATGDAEATRELQTRLAQVSAAMQQQGLNLQGQLGFADIDLRRMLGLEQLNQNALQTILGAL